MIRLAPPQPKKVKVKVSPSPKPTPISTPQILKVWSCKDSNLQPEESVSFENINRSIKSERMSTDGVHYIEAHHEPPLSIDMSTILTDDKLSSQLLTLMETDVCTHPRDLFRPETNPNVLKNRNIKMEGQRAIIVKNPSVSDKQSLRQR